MKNLGLFSKDTNINFLKYRKFCFLFSLILIIFLILLPVFKGLNLGVDFKGGVVVIVKPLNSENIFTVKNLVSSLKLDTTFKEFENGQVLQVIVSNTQSQNNNPIDAIRKVLHNKAEIIKTEFIGPSVSKQLLKGGTISVLLALLGIFVYVYFRFDWQYAFIAVLTLIHDAIIGVGALNLVGYEINISTIAAILTIIGYSVNDTIITFNQVKENIKRYPNLGNIELLNRSLNDVISRTISTSTTVILVLLSVYLFGGSSLTSFSFTLLIGVIFGTYSSLFIAVPALLYMFDFRSIIKASTKEQV